MTIDVSKLKAGDVVLVEAVFKGQAVTMDLLFFKTCTGVNINFTKNEATESIRGCLPAPFDWKDAKPGMAFIFRESGETVYYSGPDPFNKKYVICVIDAVSPSAAYRMSDLTPAPEHDIEVPE